MTEKSKVNAMTAEDVKRLVVEASQERMSWNKTAAIIGLPLLQVAQAGQDIAQALNRVAYAIQRSKQ